MKKNGELTFGGMVRLVREAHGWTQERLAAESRLSRAHVAKIELGRLPAGPQARSRLTAALGFILGAELEQEVRRLRGAHR